MLADRSPPCDRRSFFLNAETAVRSDAAVGPGAGEIDAQSVEALGDRENPAFIEESMRLDDKIIGGELADPAACGGDGENPEARGVRRVRHHERGDVDDERIRERAVHHERAADVQKGVDPLIDSFACQIGRTRNGDGS